MNALSIKDFRSKMASSFNRVDAGERVVIRRKNQLYALVPVEEDEVDVTPELQKKIDKAWKEHQDGETLCFASAKDAQRWMDAL